MSDKQFEGSLGEFVDSVKISARTKKIHMEYPDFKNYCKRMGISSYLLDLIISRVRDDRSRDSDILDKSYFVIDRNVQTPENHDNDKQLIKKLRDSVAMLENKLIEKESQLEELSQNIETERMEREELEFTLTKKESQLANLSEDLEKERKERDTLECMLRKKSHELECTLTKKESRLAELSKILEIERKKRERRIWPYWAIIVFLLSVLGVLLYVILTNSQLRYDLYVLSPFN